MAYINVADWKSEQVAEWLKGLDSVVLQYIGLFIEKNVNGEQLLDLQPNDLEGIGVHKIGHQEIILEAVELLKNFYYDLDRENLQLLALRLSCLAHSLHNELWKNHVNSSIVSTQVLADVANVVSAVKPLVCWLDRSPFSDQLSYVDKKNEMLKLSLEIAMSGMRDRFVDKPIEYIRQSSKQLAELADKIIQDVDDSLLLQPASLDLATLKKRPGDHLGFYIVPSFHGILQVGELKCNSAAHQSGKIETGDEIVQINYQTVVGWEVKEVMSLLFEESSTEVLMTLKKRPRHSKVFGQIYIKPYRLPCRKQMSYSTKWNDLLSPSRPELLTVPAHFRILPRTISSKPVISNVGENLETNRALPPSPTPSTVSSISSRSSESELMAGPSSPNSVRLYLPKPRIPVQRRATITGASPVSKHAPLSLEQFWHELKLEREWRSNSDEKPSDKANSETQLKRSPPIAHCSLNWSARLCEQDGDDLSKKDTSCLSEKSITEWNECENNGIIPLKERIDCLSRAVEQTGGKKPKLFPKPLLSLRNTSTRAEAIQNPLKMPTMSKQSDRSPRKERGKLDKSYSTPSYDCSVDSREPLTFNMKLLEEKVKSAPDNITSEVEPLSHFRMSSLEIRTSETNIEKLELVTEDESKNEYLEIKNTEQSNVTNAPLPKKEIGDNKILDTIDSSLLFDSEQETCSNKCETKTLLQSSMHFTFPEPTFLLPSTNGDNDSPILEETTSINSDSLKLVESNISQSTERLHIHTTINIPATFPRHKLEYRKTISPPEPPPRPTKMSPIHSKPKSIPITKSSSKSGPHKSPRVLRKKNIWLTKRRSVSVKDLGVVDHEGWLYHRSRKMARGSPQWIKGWFIIKGTIFYGFNSREATHARLMIFLPGFTVSPAEEVKSRNFSFKVYHTGTTFYFAAESEDELSRWVESFSRVTVSYEEQSVIMSETDCEEDDEFLSAKKDKSSHDGHGSHIAAMKKLTGLLSGHLSGTLDSKNGDKKFSSLKKSMARKGTREEQESNQAASLDRKYLKFLSGSSKQIFNPVPTAHFRSYRRVPPMERSPFSVQNMGHTADMNRSDSAPAVSVPSASPTRPPDMADYRLASLTKSNINNQRNPETTQPGAYMTLESFMLSRQEEERRHQLQQPRATNILRVPQSHAPPPPTHTVSHNVAAATGLETSSSFYCNSRSAVNSQPNAAISNEKNWTEFCSHNHKFGDVGASTVDCRLKYLKKTTQYQPPPWDIPNYRLNEEPRLQPAFEMTLDRNSSADQSTGSKIRKSDDSFSTSLRFRNLFSSTKMDNQKTNLINSPRLRRVLSRDRKNQNSSILISDAFAENRPSVEYNSNSTSLVVHPSNVQLPNTPDYPGLQYPPVFEPGSYSLSDVSTLLRGRRIRASFDNIDDPMVRLDENNVAMEESDVDCATIVPKRVNENMNNNEAIQRNENSNMDDENESEI